MADYFSSVRCRCILPGRFPDSDGDWSDPSIASSLAGSNYRYLLSASLVGGVTFLLLVDNVARNLLEVEIPIGILTAFIATLNMQITM